MNAIAAALAVLLAAAPAAVGQTAVVKRQGARLMKAPRFYGSACREEIEPGRQVRILERQRGWARIAAPGAGKCWLHESAWSDRTAGALAGAAPSASQRDVELAGRGFSEAEEARFRGEHGGLAAAFDAIEAHLARGPEAGPEDLARFAAEGGLRGGR